MSLVSPLFAMHEADHRYTVLGYVRDAQGEGKGEIAVTVEHKGGQKLQAKSNGSGYYEAVLHLHDTNVGDEVIVTAGAEVKRITIAFDVEDKHSNRSGQVDFGAPAKETPIVYWLGAGGGGLLLCAAIYFVLTKKKKQSLKKEKRRKV